MDKATENGSLTIYKYRRRNSNTPMFIQPLSGQRLFDGDNIDSEEIKSEEEPRHYTILQEPRSEFTNTKIRYTLLVYSNSAWKIFVLTILALAYILDTWLYTFLRMEERPFWLIIVIICLNFVFAADVSVVIGLKFVKKWRKTLNLVEPATSRVIIDIVLAVPYSLLYLVSINFTLFDFYAIPPIIALLRVYRIIEYFYNRSSQAGSNQWTTFLSQYLILFLMSVHTWTCVWYLFSYENSDTIKVKNSWAIEAIFLPTETIFDWYFLCAYWSVMFLTSNALGDLYPVTTTERIIAILAILLGFLLTTVVFVGSLTSQFLTITTRRSKYIQQLKKVKNHLRLIKMDLDTTTRIMRYYKDLWYQKSGVFKPKLLGLLPYPLQTEICYDLNAVPLYSSLLFRKLPDSFLRRLSLAMAHQFYLPGDIVFKQNQNKTMMVCITTGVMELLSDEDDESPIISFSKGTCFGEISLIYNIPAKCTVKAATYVECQVLEKTEFIKLMITYPDLVDDIRQQITDRVVRAYIRKETHKDVTEMTSLNIYASKNYRKSNIKRLKDKLRYIQEKTNEDLSKDDYLDENCLDLYILSEHIKKRLSPFTCLSSKFPWILEHNCTLVKCWELYMLVNVIYICILYPYYIGIERRFPQGMFFFIDVITLFSLITNIVITTITAVKTKKHYITNFYGILKFRMKTVGFYLDLISIIPFENLVYIHTTVGYTDNFRNQLFNVCKGVKLCLIWRVSNFFDQIEKKLLNNTIVIKIIKYVTYICLLCYWAGVILIMESCFVNQCSEDSWFAKMISGEPYASDFANRTNQLSLTMGIYFSTTILLAVGYGDISPGDQYDMAFVAFLTLYGVLLTGYCVAEFSTVITHWSRTKTAFLEVIITIENFMKENQMHPAIKSRILAFSELQWQYNAGVELTGDNWLDKTVVPLELRKKVLHQARFKALTSIKFFQVKNKAFIHTLTESARDIILPPGEIVYYGGTVTRELYIIESGYCLLTFSDTTDKKIERVIGPGNHLGLLVLLYGVPAVSTLISISYYAYTSALSLFPDMREHDNLLTSEEIQQIVTQAKNQNANAYLQHYNNLRSKKKVQIRNLLSQFLDNSFINVLHYYRSNGKSYLDSYKAFKILNNIAPYLLMPIVFKPDGIFLKSWAIMRVAVAFIICLLIPIVVSAAPMCGVFNELVITLEIICYIDMYLMLHVGYYGPKNQLIYHPYLTAKNYLKGPFLTDFITSFPWYAIWKLFVPKHEEGHASEDHAINNHIFHCTLRMINVSQIYKLYAAFWAESIGALKRAYLMSVVQFLLLMLFFLNFYMCILVAITCNYVVASSPEEFLVKIENIPLKKPYMATIYNPDGNMICKRNTWIDKASIVTVGYLTPQKVYLLAYYWTVATFSGAGFGDITAQEMMHMILSICVIIHGVLFFGYVYAKIASLKAVADQVLTRFEENLKHLEMFMTKEKVPTVLRRTVVDYWKYQWKRTGGWSHQSILGKLHANLNEDAVLYMYEKTLREIPLFEDVESSFFRAFAKKLKEVYFQKGYMVIRSNEVITTMYIIYRGKVDIVSDINEVEACMGPGGILGNIRGATRYLTMSNILASRNIDLLAIQGADFYALLKSYPSVLRKVINSVNSAAKDYVLPTTISERASLALSNIPTSYQYEDEEDEIDIPNPFLDVIQSPEKSIAESHGSRSVASGNVDYVPAGYLLFFPHRWFTRSIVPDSNWFTFMEYLTLFISYVDFMLLVYQMAFLSNEYFHHICSIFDIIFLYKLFLDFHSGYMNRYGDYILNPQKVRKVFFSNVWFRRRDFLANLPISYIAFLLPLHSKMQTYFFTYLRTPQLFRVTYLFTFKLHRKVNIGSGNLIIKLMKIGIWASILSHVNACLFFKLSCLTPVHCTSNNWLMKHELNLRVKLAKSDFFSIYITALWYMINLLTISGTGDVSSQNDFEVVETIAIIIIIKFCTGLLISEMSAMITAHSSSRIAYDYGINELKHGLRDMGLSGHQMSKMWEYVRELWNRQQGRQMPVLTHELPFCLRGQVMQSLYGVHIRQSVIFGKTEDDFKRMLVMWMRHSVFFPGNYIVQCGDSDQCIYFIHRGETGEGAGGALHKVEVLTVHQNLTESIYDILGPEDSFGIAQGLYVGISHYFSFRARTVVDIVHLKLDQWKYLLDFYPKSAKIVQRKVENVYLAI